MNVFEIIAGSLLLICCLALIILVMLQEPKQGGLGSTFGDSSSTDSYFGKNSGRTLEAILGRFTKWFAIGFFVLTILVSIFSVYIS